MPVFLLAVLLNAPFFEGTLGSGQLVWPKLAVLHWPFLFLETQDFFEMR
jgi:hypothetical protein